MYLTSPIPDTTDMKTLAYTLNTVTGRFEDSLSEGGIYPLRAVLAVSALALVATAIRLF